MRWSLLLIALAGCASQQPPPPAPPEIPATTAPAPASLSASGSAPVAPAAGAPLLFVPLEPLVPPPLATSNGAEKCRVSDLDLGDALNVVEERQWAKTLDAVQLDTRPTLEPWQQDGGSNAGYDYGFVTIARTPVLEREAFPKPGPTRFTLADPEWRGLPDFQWSGTRFVAGRLSVKGKKARAKLFAVDCR